jgi:glycosyltransferase involved in cell wall biosynthesis
LLSYVLITPARNEEAYMEQLIDTMTQQTHTPAKWVIVNDGSTDRTAEIVRRHLPHHAWMELVELPGHRDRSFAAKAHCFKAGYARLAGLNYDVIGNLDSDLTFEPDYIEFLMRKFAEDAQLGVAGTAFVEEGYHSAVDSFEGETHVAGGCQLFRRVCFEQVGGYIPTKIGMDWIAVTTARMLGWKTRAFREKVFVHHRALGTGDRSRLAAWRLYGEKDYRLGWHPVYELFRVLYQFTRDPLAGCNIALGYSGALVRRIERPVSDELMRFHRAEQMGKLRRVVGSLARLRTFDKFFGWSASS